MNAQKFLGIYLFPHEKAQIKANQTKPRTLCLFHK